MTTATDLRRAARLMRERAEAASRTAPSPWIVQEMEICTDDQEPIEAISVVTSQIHWRDAAAQRAHVASWHPAVAVAVADWLDSVASVAERLGGTTEPRALAVARAYLGESR